MCQHSQIFTTFIAFLLLQEVEVYGVSEKVLDSTSGHCSKVPVRCQCPPTRRKKTPAVIVDLCAARYVDKDKTKEIEATMAKNNGQKRHLADFTELVTIHGNITFSWMEQPVFGINDIGIRVLAGMTLTEQIFLKTVKGIVKQCNHCRDGDGVFRLCLNGKEIGGLDARVKGEFMIILGDLKYRLPERNVGGLAAIVTNFAPHIRRTAYG